jgi:hypothetical protein
MAKDRQANHENLALNFVAVTSTAAELNVLDGSGVSNADLIKLAAVTSTAAELNLNDDICASISIAYAASATTDGIEATYTVKDAAGVAIDAVHHLDITITDVATGIGVTSTSASGALTIVTGTQLEEVVAKKHLRCQTDVNGVLTVKLVDSANTADEYFCVKNPVNGKIIVGPATVATDYEGGV